jgi:hypothetical protein
MTDQDANKDTSEDEALPALHELISEGGWQPTDGGPAMRVYIRPWPDNSADSLMFSDPDGAYAERVNPNGEPVWQLTGTVAKTVAALLALPPPDAPDAPRAILPRQDSADRDM